MRQSEIEPLDIGVLFFRALLQIIQLGQHLFLLDLIEALAGVDIGLHSRHSCFQECERLDQLSSGRQIPMAGYHLRILSQVIQNILISRNGALGAAGIISIHVPAGITARAEAIGKVVS